jgi:ribonuclease HII
VAGVDEVGRGPLAGPVVAAAVILPERVRLPGATDSKLLTPLARERLHALILARAADVAWAAVGPTVIDRINVLQASYLAMRLALERLRTPPDVVLVDGNPVPGLDPSESIVGGDRKELCIACASIVAKVVRDRMMDIYDAVYEGYGFATNRGYATADHLRAVRVSGPCPIHRWSYQPVAQTSFVDEL